jgi:hypothetical protein
MAKMILGGHTFAHNPRDYRRVYPAIKDVGTVKTMESEATFDFGIRIAAEGLIGSRWSMSWPHMRRSEFDYLRALYEATGTITWDPKDYRAHDTGKTYQVIVVDLKSSDYDMTTLHVKDVEMTLEITAVN